MENKKCSKCLEIKPVSEFHRCLEKFASRCKKCKRAEYFANPEPIKERSRKNKQANPEKYKELDRLCRERNKEKRNKQARDRRRSDPEYRIRHNLRMRMNRAVKGIAKSDNTMKLLGCTIEEFRRHLENQFLEGMSWDNYGIDGWHIDHIKPCNFFDMSKEEDQKACFHYTNMQPLWAIDNIRKSDKY